MAANTDRDGGEGGPDHLGILNSDNNLNIYPLLTSNLEPDEFNQYTEINVDSAFYDSHTIIKKIS